MITKTIIELSGRLDWNWRNGNLDTVKKSIQQIRSLLTKLEKDLPKSESGKTI